MNNWTNNLIKLFVAKIIKRESCEYCVSRVQSSDVTTRFSIVKRIFTVSVHKEITISRSGVNICFVRLLRGEISPFSRGRCGKRSSLLSVDTPIRCRKRGANITQRREIAALDVILSRATNRVCLNDSGLQDFFSRLSRDDHRD